MKRQPKPVALQMNLTLREPGSTPHAAGKEAELTQALSELLLSAALERMSSVAQSTRGGDDEPKTNS